jgi:hypothetical protein
VAHANRANLLTQSHDPGIRDLAVMGPARSVAAEAVRSGASCSGGRGAARGAGRVECRWSPRRARSGHRTTRARLVRGPHTKTARVEGFRPLRRRVRRRAWHTETTTGRRETHHEPASHRAISFWRRALRPSRAPDAFHLVAVSRRHPRCGDLHLRAGAAADSWARPRNRDGHLGCDFVSCRERPNTHRK